MVKLRHWSVRHAAGMQSIYQAFERVLIGLHPLWQRIGYERLEKPFAAIESVIKGWLFDCQMCGQCVLTSTGMSCPMNCPKTLRNGPCGGVRANGCCEVKTDMPCVWVEAYQGSQRMPGGPAAMRVVQIAVDRRLQGQSSWLRLVREKTAERSQQAKAPGAAP